MAGWVVGGPGVVAGSDGDLIALGEGCAGVVLATLGERLAAVGDPGTVDGELVGGNPVTAGMGRRERVPLERSGKL